MDTFFKALKKSKGKYNRPHSIRFAITNSIDLVTYKEQKFISHRTEAEKSKVMLSADLQSLFIRALILVMKALPL